MDSITIDKILQTISVLANILVLVGGWWILFKKAKPEIDKAKAESVAESASAAESYAMAAKTFADELRLVKIEITELKESLKDRDELILEQKQTIADLKDWASRLMFQVKSLNGNPVPFRKERKEQKVP